MSEHNGNDTRELLDRLKGLPEKDRKAIIMKLVEQLSSSPTLNGSTDSVAAARNFLGRIGTERAKASPQREAFQRESRRLYTSKEGGKPLDEQNLLTPEQVVERLEPDGPSNDSLR
jgi:hypothetical protein